MEKIILIVVFFIVSIIIPLFISGTITIISKSNDLGLWWNYESNNVETLKDE